MQGFNLIEHGLAQQQAILDMRPDYSRIVGVNENLHEVMLEAIEHGAYVWANPAKQRTCINTSMPNSKGWMKVHGTYTTPPLDAA